MALPGQFTDGSGFDAEGNPVRANGQPYRPLPQIARSGQATYAQPAQPNQSDPVSNFNLRLMEMLKEFQQPQLARKSQLEDAQNTQALSREGMDQFRPNYQAQAIQDRGNEYNQAISNINDRMKSFENVLKVAEKAGEAYAKTVKPSEQTIAAAKLSMKYGQLPPDSTMAKLGNSITEDDWVAYAAAKKTDNKPSQGTENINGMSYRMTYDDKGNVINKVLLGPSGDPESPGDVSKKELGKVKEIISMYPGEWGDAADAIDREFGRGTATKYNALLKDTYMTKEDKLMERARAKGLIK